MRPALSCGWPLPSCRVRTVHHGQLALHRKTGLAIFLLFPFFLIGGVWVIHLEATTLAGDFTSVGGRLIAQIGSFDLLANIALTFLFWAGLKYRYKVHLHARYMLARCCQPNAR